MLPHEIVDSSLMEYFQPCDHSRISHGLCRIFFDGYGRLGRIYRDTTDLEPIEISFDTSIDVQWYHLKVAVNPVRQMFDTSVTTQYELVWAVRRNGAREFAMQEFQTSRYIMNLEFGSTQYSPTVGTRWNIEPSNHPNEYLFGITRYTHNQLFTHELFE